MSQPAVIAPSLADEQRDLVRTRITRAAGLVLAARGLAATIDDVAEAAGVSRRTIFRHFATRESLFAAAIRAGIRRYAEQLPIPPGEGDLSRWLADVLLVTHGLNARNGRVFWELVGLQAGDLSGEFAAVAAECRDSRNRFAVNVTMRMWQARGGRGQPPAWLTDAVAVHLSGFTTQSLAGDLGRPPEEVAAVSAQVLEAALGRALGT
ncbi:MAG TPA: TetR/AcrR family transcriptional regulator [Streptosporangiaceae bacterium]